MGDNTKTPWLSQKVSQLRWRLTFGTLLIVAGSAAVVLPQVFTLTVELLVGFLLLISGVLSGAQALQLRGQKGFGWQLFSALIALVAGVLLLGHPLAGIASLTIILGAYFLGAGISKIVLAFQARPEDTWGWLLFSGLLDTCLGGLVFIYWLSAAPWFIGMLFGVSLISSGWWSVVSVLMARSR